MKKMRVIGVAVVLVLSVVAIGAWRFSRCTETVPFVVGRSSTRNAAELLSLLGPPTRVIDTRADQIFDPKGANHRFAPIGADRFQINPNAAMLIVIWEPSCRRSTHSLVAIVSRDTGVTVDVHTEGELK